MRFVLPFLTCAVLVASFALLPRSSADDKDDKKKREELEKMLAEWESQLEMDPSTIASKKTIGELKGLLGKAETMELFRLDPKLLFDGRAVKEDSFHGYEITFRTTVEKAEQRTQLGDPLGKALHWSRLRMGACFNPRHGLRVTQGKRTVDFVICLECWGVLVYEGKNRLFMGALVELKTWEAAEKILSAAEKKDKEQPKP
jgi:hypothetical protein